MAKTKVPAVEGWFTTDPDAPALLGSRCGACGTYSFPRQTYLCPNPACDSRQLDEVELSRRGRIWSFTNNCYQPPPPYVPTGDEFSPFVIAAVELEAERLVVLGQMTADVAVDDLAAGLEVEVVLDTLFGDDDHEYLVWKWQLVEAGS